mgnify:FL=1
MLQTLYLYECHAAHNPQLISLAAIVLYSTNRLYFLRLYRLTYRVSLAVETTRF